MKISSLFAGEIKPGFYRPLYGWGGILLLILAAAQTSGHQLLSVAFREEAQTTSLKITPIPFGEMNGTSIFNASGVIPLADSRFLFCDNHTSDALFELNLTAEGQKKGMIIRHPLQGLVPGAVSDLESMTIAEEGAVKFVFAASSFSVKEPKAGASQKVRPSGLLRIRIQPGGGLVADNISGFRDWFLEHAPTLAASASIPSDKRGLNVEGLAWDPSAHALLFGLRTPLSGKNPILIPVRVINLAGDWTTKNLEMLPLIELSLASTGWDQGIRSIEYVAARHSFVVVVGRAVSGGNAPFQLYEWDGNRQGKMRLLDVSFAEGMKPEGVTGGSVAGKPILLFVDDAGGFQIVWTSKTKL
jgi:hypothetical protein